MKKVLKMVLVLISLFITVPVMALESKTLDLSKKGLINITLSDNENNVVNDAEITIYKLADATIKNNNLVFNYNENLNNCVKNIDEGVLTNTELECILNANIKGISKNTDNLGEVTFEELDLGLYLIMQTNDVKNYSKIKPFLLSMPIVSDNEWTYSVSGTPKVEVKSLFDLTVIKEWIIINKKKEPESIEVELILNGEVLDKVELNGENNWEYTWEQIEKSDNYTIREVEVPEGFIATYRVDNTNKLIVTNSEKLVQTGNMPWIYEILGLVGITFIIVGIVIDRRKNYEKK